MVLIGRDTYEDLSVKRFGEIVDAFAAGKGGTIEPGPQIDRQFSAAYEGATTLTELKDVPVQRAMKPKTASKPKAAPMFEVPEGEPNDLKLISGVGPGLEIKLNDLGITTWRQVADLTQDQIDEVNARLSFKGRIERDDWLAQADALAAGGIEEYVKRFGKEPR
jgi:NADH-quinone oxidoreductase subunit E